MSSSSLPCLRASALLAGLCLGSAVAGEFAPAAGVSGSTAIHKNDARFVGWATGYEPAGFQRGPTFIPDPEAPPASFGEPEDALGKADVDLEFEQTFSVVSLGDGGWITLLFDRPITNGPGPDFAVFENSFMDTFLELAFVEVSSDGRLFVRFPAVSLTPIAPGKENWSTYNHAPLDPTDLHNLAGKYRGEYGTPFDLEELGDAPGLDVTRVTHVRVVDVVGSTTPEFASFDSRGNIVKDPFPTDFSNGGFDLDAVGVLHAIPEPSSAAAGLLGALLLASGQRRARA